MGSSSQEKTEAPTRRRLDDARKRGQVAHSADLSAGLMLGLAVGTLVARAPAMFQELRSALRSAFEAAGRVHQGRFGEEELLAVVRESFAVAETILAPVLLTFVIGGLAFNFVQIGGLFSLEPLRPMGSRLDPIAGMKRLFGGSGPWVELLKSLLKILVVGFLLWNVVSSELLLLLTLSRAEPEGSGAVLGSLIGRLGRLMTIGMLVLGVLDFFWQRHKLTKELSMTKEEVKEEYKGQEGDPQHKQRRRRAHREILDYSLVQGVSKAHVVVVNPTHIACALRYDPAEEGAPRLLAKGEGHVAQRIRELAREERIPVLRNISLARALNELEIEEEVPEELFEATVVVLRYLEDTARAEGRAMPWENRNSPDSGATLAASP